MNLKSTVKKTFCLVFCVALIGCAGNEKKLLLAKGESIVFPNGTVCGGDSEQQATELAKIMVKAQNSVVQDVSQTETAKQALGWFEKISKLQGSGEITLFFQRGSYSLKKSSGEYARLIGFLDYLIRESHGRKVLLVSVGSASGDKSEPDNVKLSVVRARAPQDIIEKYLVNTPHKTYEAYGIGDSKSAATKKTSKKHEDMYQHVRIVAAFEEANLPLLPH